MSTVTDLMDHLIPQVFTPKVNFLLPKVCPTFAEVMRQGTKSANLADDIGLDWKIIWSFILGESGAAEFASVAGPTVGGTAPSTPPDFQYWQNVETWPGLLESTAPATFQKNITLKRLKLNFFVPHQLAQLAELKRSIASLIDPIVTGTARRAARLMANAWLAKSGNSVYNTIASFVATATETLTGNSSQTVTLTSTQTGHVPSSLQSLSPGTSVDVFAHNNNTRLNTAACFIGAPTGLGHAAGSQGTFKIYCPQGSLSLTNTSVYHITPRNSGRESSGATNLPTTLRETFLSSGSVFGINVATYPMFQSIIHSAALVPNEANLSKFLADIEQFVIDYGEDMSNDTFIMTPGIYSKWLQDWIQVPNSFPGATADRGRRTPDSPQLGMRGMPTYSLYGKDYGFRTEKWFPQNNMCLTRMQDNWQVIRPPRVPGSKGHPAFDYGFQFLAGVWSRNNDIFINHRQVGGGNAGAFTNFGEAPAELIYEILPKKLGGGVWFTNVSEAYIQ
jgi:hypothetical protein